MHGEKNIKRPLVTFLKQTKQIYSLSFHSFESDQDLSSLLSLHLSNNLFFLEVSPLNVCMIYRDAKDYINGVQFLLSERIV